MMRDWAEAASPCRGRQQDCRSARRVAPAQAGAAAMWASQRGALVSVARGNVAAPAFAGATRRETGPRLAVRPAMTALLAPFLDPLAFAIVAGGTLAAMILRTPTRDLVHGLAALGTLAAPRMSADPLIEQIAAFGRIAKRNGVMALDRSVIADRDVAAAVAAIVDGALPEDVAELLRQRRRARTERAVAAAELWSGAADTAPAMGMVGTLIGLVGMFVKMQDPSAIGAAMAVALLATLYGALLANLLLAPIAARLRRHARDEAVERLRLDAPLIALAARERPRGSPLREVA
ncbi:MotA/TolQ/ExbB proton channel family protein [Sphingomonas sp. RB3P16]|uniref:MotA/TolQ/ExbB proton channel family protein n=1 Tax=Parasphingomonas frigoris TaxID=3096163 RepID=UPI002FC89B7F